MNDRFFDSIFFDEPFLMGCSFRKEESKMENWLTIVVGVFLLGMVLYGHYKGLMHMAMTMVALVLSLFLVKMVTPQVSTFLKDRTPLYEMIQIQIEKKFDLSNIEEMMWDQEEKRPSYERMTIEELPVPDALKSILLENNNSEVYRTLGVQKFQDYITNYMTVFIIHIISYLITFLGVYLIVRFIFGCMNLITKLPIIHGINQLAGALMGGAEGLIVVWLVFLAVTAVSGTEIGTQLMEQIQQSPMLSFLYKNNLPQMLVMASIRQVIALI